jgi:hypothetical protein
VRSPALPGANLGYLLAAANGGRYGQLNSVVEQLGATNKRAGVSFVSAHEAAPDET